MLLSLYNLTEIQGNPSFLTNLLPGGAGTQVAGTVATPWLATPRAETLFREVVDVTQVFGSPTGSSASAAITGQAMILSPQPLNTGAGLWVVANQNAGVTPGAGYGEGQVGIVAKQGSQILSDQLPAGSGVGGVLVATQGPVSALCVTPTGGGAIVIGTLLGLDGAGNLQPFQGPSAAPTPTVTNGGTAGAVTVTYALVSIGANGTYSAIGTGGATSTSNAVGSATNFNLIQWVPPADSVGTIIVRTTATGYTPATVGVIGNVGAGVSSFSDYGLATLPNTSATQAFARPAAGATPTVVQVPGAVAGVATWSYKITAIAPNGVWGAEGTAGSITTGNATLTAANANKITWAPTTGASSYAIDRTAVGTSPSTTGFLGYATAAQGVAGFTDYGIAATTFTPVIAPPPVTAPGSGIAVSLGFLPSGTTIPTLVPVYVADR